MAISRFPRHSRHRLQVGIVYGLACIAALGAALSNAKPTEFGSVNIVWCAALGFVTTIASSRSRRWAWIWLTGLTTAAAIGTLWTYVGGIALVSAIAGAFFKLRNRILGAAIGALAIQAVLRLPDIGFHGLSAIISVTAIVPLLISAYDRSDPHDRKLIRRTTLVLGGATLIALFGFAITAVPAFMDLQRGVQRSTNGFDALREGDQQAASHHFGGSTTAFDKAHRRLTSPWIVPARFIPVLSQQITSLAHISDAGVALSSAAETASTTARYQDLKAEGGRLDLAVVRSMQEPLRNSAAALHDARSMLSQARSPWLLEPIDNRITSYMAKVDDVVPDVELAVETLEILPGLFGGATERNYLILFTTPAESRFSGGFVGAYAILNASNGHVSLTKSGKIADLNRSLDGQERSLANLDDFESFLTRYGRYNPEQFFQNVTASPDMPTNANVARELYRQSTGEVIDGIMFADPFALAALISLTGPIKIDGTAEKLNAENVAEYLLSDQYIEFEGERDDRDDRLADVASATFEALTNRNLPRPRKLTDALSGVMHEGRFVFVPFDKRELEYFDHLGATGRFAPDANHDFISLRTSNANPNKIDTFLNRSLEYEVSYDPGSGQISASATVTLTNHAPTTGLPNDIIGNDRNEPSGSNTTYMSLYSPLDLVGATSSGEPVGIEPQVEFDSNVYSLIVTVPANESVTIKLELGGSIPPNTEYGLTVLNQPTANPDQLKVAVTSADPALTMRPSEGLKLIDNRAGFTGEIRRSMLFSGRYDS